MSSGSMSRTSRLSNWLRSYLGSYRNHWKALLLFIVAYILAMWLSDSFIPHPATLFPAVAIALCILYFEGIEFWPIIMITTLLVGLYEGFPVFSLLIVPISQTLQAVLGAYLISAAKIDPLFRRARDMLFLIGSILLVSIVVPTFRSLTYSLNAYFHIRNASTIVSWGAGYTANVLCLLILTPFLLRWFAKPRFSRTRQELLETILAFLVLILINIGISIVGITTVTGVPLLYLLFIPLFWIALRLRPRFVTLALVITSVFAILGLYFGHHIPSPDIFTVQLIRTEQLLIGLAMIFFIVVSVEEDRRLNSNLLKSQVATLENAVSRVLSESKAKNDFIAVLAHELRNPLAPVVSGIDFLKIKYEKVPEDREIVTMMEERMETIRRLLDDLLDISKIIEGKVSLDRKLVDIVPILDRSVMSTSHYLRERHQSLSFKAPKDAVLVLGDSVRLEQVFSNLIANASKYSPSGAPITIQLRSTPKEVEISVSDKGMGIEESALEKIFTPFHQGESVQQNKKGLGIGLALVRGFVDMHDGTVIAESAGLGKGSTFTVTLPSVPTKKDEPSPKQTIHKKQTFMPSEPTKSGPRVLVVDDNEAAASGMGRLLDLKGCTVFYAYDGEHAIKEAEEAEPDVILLDIGLPDMDGYTVARTIRTQGYQGRLIALTGFSTDDARAKGASAGFDHYLIKPIGFEEIKQVIPEIA